MFPAKLRDNYFIYQLDIVQLYNSIELFPSTYFKERFPAAKLVLDVDKLILYFAFVWSTTCILPTFTCEIPFFSNFNLLGSIYEDNWKLIVVLPLLNSRPAYSYPQSLS